MPQTRRAQFRVPGPALAEGRAGRHAQPRPSCTSRGGPGRGTVHTPQLPLGSVGYTIRGAAPPRVVHVTRGAGWSQPARLPARLADNWTRHAACARFMMRAPVGELAQTAPGVYQGGCWHSVNEERAMQRPRINPPPGVATVPGGDVVWRPVPQCDVLYRIPLSPELFAPHRPRLPAKGGGRLPHRPGSRAWAGRPRPRQPWTAAALNLLGARCVDEAKALAQSRHDCGAIAPCRSRPLRHDDVPTRRCACSTV